MHAFRVVHSYTEAIPLLSIIDSSLATLLESIFYTLKLYTLCNYDDIVIIMQNIQLRCIKNACNCIHLD